MVDVSGMGQLLGTDVSVPVAAKYDTHPITDRFNLLTAYPLARSVTSVEGGVNGHTAQNLVEHEQEQLGGNRHQAADHVRAGRARTRQGRQGGTGVAGGSGLGARPPMRPPPASDASRQLPASPPMLPKPETRLVVFGDSDFVTNGYLGIPGNRDLFLNSVNWLAQQENLISIRPKDPEDRRVTLTADQAKLIFWLSILIIPGLILAAGVQTWWRRR